MLPGLLLAVLGSPLLWQRPAIPVESVSFERAARGIPEPQPPFRFLQEELSGNSAKVLVRDAAGRVWQVKGGPEARADAFVTRLASALGYYADGIWFLRLGRIEKVGFPLRRAGGFIQRDGTFTYASFELRDESARYIGDGEWTWERNPFAGSPELAGLRLLVMLVSDWDNKDARDVSDGSNTSVIEADVGGTRRRVYYVNDWGQALGSWGYVLWFGRSHWNCADYRAQTANFVKREGSGLRFGYRGQHTEGFSRGLRVDEARWLLQYLGRVTESQLHAGLRASGASVEEENCFVRALTERINLLRRAVQ